MRAAGGCAFLSYSEVARFYRACCAEGRCGFVMLLWEEGPDHYCCAMACQAMSLSDQMEKDARLTPPVSLEAENLV